MSRIDTFLKMLEQGQDSALLRYSLGSAYQEQGQVVQALEHLARAVEQDSAYSAAWKAYAKALMQTGQVEQAAQAYRKGISVAELKGDVQAAKEMKVFLRRIEKAESQ